MPEPHARIQIEALLAAELLPLTSSSERELVTPMRSATPLPRRRARRCVAFTARAQA